MDLVLARSFVTVAKYGSITAAARQLGVSQSALSRRLQLLEEQSRVELLRPSGRGVVLTEAGRIFERGCSEILERFDRIGLEIAEHLDHGAGTVRVGGGATAVSYLLPEAMARFRKAHPKIRFHLEEAGSREVAEAVLGERLDLGIVTLPVASRELSVSPLLSDRIVLVAARPHPFAGRARVAPEELHERDLIGFEAGSAIRRLIDEALLGAGVRMNVVMEVRSIAAILRLVESTGSLAFVSAMGVRGRGVVAVRGLPIQRRLGLVTKKGKPLSRAAGLFSAALVEAARAHRGAERK